MIAQDFFRARVLASGSIAVAYGAASTCAHTEKRPTRARQRSLLVLRTPKTEHISLKYNDLYSFNKRLGETCGLEVWGVHDARIAAICVAHGVETLFTRDRDFSLFPEIRTSDPLARQ